MSIGWRPLVGVWFLLVWPVWHAFSQQAGQIRIGHFPNLTHAQAVYARATGQFDIADSRSAEEMAELVRRLGYEPVWKDWDAALTA